MRKAFLKRFKVLTTSAMMLTAALAFTGCAGSSSEKESAAATKESAENTTAATKETEAPATTAAEETTAAPETTVEATTAAPETTVEETTVEETTVEETTVEDETTADEETADETGSEDEGIKIGEGETHFDFSVTFSDGSEKHYCVYTDEENVGAALLDVELIAGEDSQYGLYVKTVDSETADYDTDGHYWAFYIDGEYAMTGVDSTPIEDGKAYAFKYE